MPERIQRKRTKGWRMPEGAIYVGRPSRWGNPFAVVGEPNWPRWGGRRPFLVQSEDGRYWYPPEERRVIVGAAAAQASSYARAVQHAVDLFALHTGPMGNYEYDADQIEDLRKTLAGHDLACWCPLDQPCHADVLLEIANGPAGGDDEGAASGAEEGS